MVDVVEQHRGSVNKYEGDAVLAIFGAPVPVADAAGDALAAARELNRRLNRPDADLKVGIGVSAGMTVAGNMGDPSRYEYKVIGDPVNEAARLSELAKRLGGVAVSGAALVRAHQPEAQRWHVIESKVLRGRGNSTEIAVPRDDE
ncbi:adenylate/guanylate cyclase domain-containing protein [Mycobacterium xenopi]|uniref:adenylate/guanylate cyclase domain-containing protein n=1 Tax=Mycobacterium xenopi TaxID=1789 RepID=UPI001FD1F2BD|nr:adenylate/guanylate cyclase domain-containing protein [Mycobacterium xenopi]MDA3638929.1 adenylate/guanylate cyclase domain-containing protein [Mycobacterium xenopi]